MIKCFEKLWPQFFKAFDQVDNELVHKFTIDFAKEKLGMPHQMRFGAYSLYANTPNNKNMAIFLLFGVLAYKEYAPNLI